MRTRRRHIGWGQLAIAVATLIAGAAAAAEPPRLVPVHQAGPPAPLPGPAWSDPDSVNWIDVPAAAPTPPPPQPRIIGRIADRRIDGRASVVPVEPRRAAALAERIRSRLRGDGRIARALGSGEPAADGQATITDGWPTPDRLIDQLESLAVLAADAEHAAVAAWAEQALVSIHATLETQGPADPSAPDELLALGEAVATGMVTAEQGLPPHLASETRRAALAVARRVAVWRAAADWSTESEPASPRGTDVGLMLGARPAGNELDRLLAFIEHYEAAAEPAQASAVKAALAGVNASPSHAASELVRAVSDHYLAPNVRLAVHRGFVERMLPESTVTDNAVQDFILGRPVRGRSTVEQSMAVRFLPHPGEIRMELVINGQVASRTVTESGPVAIHSKSNATFVVLKPIHLTSTGLAIAPARGSAATRAQLADIETSFDSVPIMGSLVRTIARNQHDDARAEASREASNKIVHRACREVDQQAGPKLDEMAERIRERVWQPLVGLGLEPTPVGLETTADVASLRLRLAADSQLAAHTPRPRAPADALLSMQFHETVANNAFERFGLAGRRLELPELARLVCERMGIETRVPDDLPDGVAVTFAQVAPLRIECREGLVHVRVALDAIESGRRNWYDLVAQVAYKPVAAGPQVLLEREGPVRIGGPDHEGRMEIALRTIFGKIFAKERPIAILPEKVTANPRLATVRAVQAVATDGWLGIALAEPVDRMTGRPAAPSPTAVKPATTDRGPLRR
ncbi:MAG: hypothetical protein ACKO1M_09240 [Planctomycetota bacterium]